MIKTIADQNGITRSLDKLFLTQSAVSHQLKDLEERLGTRIFYRSKNQWTLTEEGKVLYDAATRILADLEQTLDRINDMRGGLAGTIRISTGCYTSYHWLPSFLNRMRVLYPELDIKIMIEATHRPLQKLRDNELDVGIISDLADDKSLRYIELFKDEVMAVVQSENPLASRKYLTAQDFTTQPLIIHSLPLESVTVYQYFMRQQNVQPSQITAIPLTEVALEMVKANMGIMTMPLWALKPFVASPDLKLVRIGPKGLSRTHYAALRHEDAAKKHIVDFIHNLREELEK